MESDRTADGEVGDERSNYEAMQVPEYWRFDHTGEHHGAMLAGDQLVDERYMPIPIDTRKYVVLQGSSAALDLYPKWDKGEVVLVDAATDAPILTYEDQKRKAKNEAAKADQAEQRVRQQGEGNCRIRGK